MDTAIELGKKAFGNDDQTVETLKKIHEECGVIDDPDQCEQAHQRFMCAKQAADKYGLMQKKH